MTQENAFNGLIRVYTKTFGEINDENQATGFFDNEPYTSTEARVLLMRGTKFVTSGNATFLVGSMVAPYGGSIFDIVFDVDELEYSDETTANIWIPCSEIISIIEPT